MSASSTEMQTPWEKTKTLVFMVSTSIFLGFKISRPYTSTTTTKNLVFLFDNQNSRNLREGLRNVDTL